jgi:hypothetical protein
MAKITDNTAVNGWWAIYWNGKENVQISAPTKDIFGLKMKLACRQKGNVTFHVGYVDIDGNVKEIGYCRGILVHDSINGNTTADKTVVFKMIG